jgi:hypothetical protein
MGETRVNLRHLLEDIRDTYPFPVEEAVITELVANALDSGATEIRFTTQPEAFIVVDNGQGMSPSQLERYHDIATTTKERGKGIGLAGLGAKLALLAAHTVLTETRSGRFCNATRWRFESQQRAPWELIEPGDLIQGPQGTAVTLELDRASPLAEGCYVSSIIQNHFQPLLEAGFRPLTDQLYPNGIRFWVNGHPLKPRKVPGVRELRPFTVQLGNSGRAVGIGFLGRGRRSLPESDQGIAISAYGKVVKRGWDWLGLTPRHPQSLTGLVEVPALVALLTTNKADFLKDGTSLNRYYRYRKAIQQTLAPILRELGEAVPARQRSAPEVRPLERDVEQVLGGLIENYPEIAPLVGRRRTRRQGFTLLPTVEGTATVLLTQGLHERNGHNHAPVDHEPAGSASEPSTPKDGKLETNEDGEISAGLRAGKRVAPGLMLGFEDAPRRSELGWLVENTIWVNRAHPAYQKAIGAGHENYHVVLSVVWVLLGHLDDRHSAQEFISQFLRGWGARS